MRLRIVDKIVHTETGRIYKFPVKSDVRVIKNQSAVQKIVSMMKLVTKRGGTACKAGIPGYDVAGKSGTSQKWINGEYSHSKHLSSFIGFVPADNPAFILKTGRKLIINRKAETKTKTRKAIWLFSSLFMRFFILLFFNRIFY